MRSGLDMTISKRTGAFIVAAAALIIYANTLLNGFVWDDHSQILGNRWLHDIRSIPEIFTHDAWGFRDEGRVNTYRPLMHVFHMITYQAFGVTPWPHHLVNAAAHALVSVMVFLVIGVILDERQSRADNAWFALAGALLFAAHPVHGEVVAWASALAELLASSLGLAVFYLYARSRGETNLSYYFSAALFLAALFTKETSSAILPIMAVYDYCIRGRVRPGRYAAYLAAFGLYAAFRMNALGGFAPVRQHLELTAYECVINAVPLFGAYVYKLILPVTQKVFYAFHPVRSIFEVKFIAGAVFTAGYGAALWFSRGGIRLALAWMAIALLPVLYVPALWDNVFAERYLYLPSAGFALLSAIAISEASERGIFGRHTGRVLVAAAAAVFLLYSAAAITRNSIWKNDYTLWTRAVEESPDGSIPRHQLGMLLYKAGRYAEALEHLMAAATNDPLNDDIRINIGVLYANSGLMEQAAAEFEAAVRINPSSINGHRNLGLAYKKLGRMDESAREYGIAERLMPHPVN